jgi:phage-related tail protein
MTKSEKAELRVTIAKAKQYVADLQVGLRTAYKEIKAWKKDADQGLKQLKNAEQELEALKKELRGR